MVEEFGISRWGFIAKIIETRLNNINRTGKQCRERWHNHLNPEISRQGWTETEKNKILELHVIYGNRWSKIAQHLEGRTDNAVKNFFYSNLRKKMRKNARNKALSKKKNLRQDMKIVDERQNEIRVLNENAKEKEKHEEGIERNASKILMRMAEGEERKIEETDKKIENAWEKVETVSAGCEMKGAFFPSCGNFYMLPFIYSQQLMQYQLNQAMFLANSNQRNNNFL